ncbi:MAG: zinc metalloprotease HtpX [bacterium]|nr:zinc metalloprotease HtpX [bacterium]
MALNHLKTLILLSFLTALMLGAGQILGGQTGLIIALVVALLMNFGSYWFSDKIVLKIYRAKPVTEHDEPKLHKMVSEVSQLAGIPKPKVYILPSENANAFATGRSPSHAAVACTKGIMDLLSDDELKGVIAHEVAHIKNRDTLIQTIAATIAGVISYLAFFARFAAIFGGGRDRDSGDLFQIIALSIITPIIAVLLQLAISRSREFLADATGAKTIHNPHALASALEKLNNNAKHHPMRMGSNATSSLFIVNPFHARGLLNLMSTHPDMKTRVERLRSMQV